MGTLDLKVMERLAEAIERLNKNLEANNQDFLPADDAAPLVGLLVTPSGSHRNRLTAAYKKGLLPNTIHGRPYLFARKDLTALAVRIAQGEVRI